MCTVAPVTVQSPAAAYETSSVDDAVAPRTKSPSPNVLPLSEPKVID